MDFTTGIYTGLVIGAVCGFAAALLLDRALDVWERKGSERRMAKYGERAMQASRRTP